MTMLDEEDGHVERVAHAEWIDFYAILLGRCQGWARFRLVNNPTDSGVYKVVSRIKSLLLENRVNWSYRSADIKRLNLKCQSIMQL